MQPHNLPWSDQAIRRSLGGLAAYLATVASASLRCWAAVPPGLFKNVKVTVFDMEGVNWSGWLG
jgi:hypothetical protein